MKTWPRQWIANAAQIVGACFLIVGVVGFTIYHEYPEWRRPGELVLPAAVVAANSPSEHTWRVAAVLRRYAHDDFTADRIAGAIVDQGYRRNIDPALLVGVLLTESHTLDTSARSMVGATGLMQVMSFHKGKWGCRSTDLLSIESNICHGAGVLEDALRHAPNTRVALLRYNGCVNGTNTPNCHTYPDRVLRVANRTTAQMLSAAQ